MKAKGPFTPSPSANAATMLRRRQRFSSHWKQWSCLEKDCSPILEQVHCFQREQHRWHHHRVVAMLTLISISLGVNRIRVLNFHKNFLWGHWWTFVDVCSGFCLACRMDFPDEQSCNRLWRAVWMPVDTLHSAVGSKIQGFVSLLAHYELIHSSDFLGGQTCETKICGFFLTRWSDVNEMTLWYQVA